MKGSETVRHVMGNNFCRAPTRCVDGGKWARFPHFVVFSRYPVEFIGQYLEESNMVPRHKTECFTVSKKVVSCKCAILTVPISMW